MDDNKRRKKEQDIVREILERNDSIAPKVADMVSISSERAAISIMLTSPDNFHKVRYSLDQEDFAGNTLNAKAFEIICKVSDKRNNGGYVTPEQVLYEEEFVEELKKHQVPDYIETLRSVPYNEIAVDKVLKVLKAKTIQRQLWAANCEQAERLLDFEGEDPSDLVAMASEKTMDLITNIGADVFDIRNYGDNIWEDLRELEENASQIRGYPLTMFPAFTAMSNGIVPGRSYLIAARTKRGKSVLLNQMACNLGIIGLDAENPGKMTIPVGYVDSEMSFKEQRNRSLAMISGVEEKKISNGLYKFNEKDKHLVYEAAKLLQDCNLDWTRRAIFTVKDIVTAFKILIALKGIKVGFFDQIKDTADESRSGKDDSERQRLGWLSLNIKNLCETEKIAIVSAMQLNRGGVDDSLRKEKIDPTVVLSGSDKIIHFADLAAYMARFPMEEIMKWGGHQNCGDTVLNIFANRGGESHDIEGGIGMHFRRRLTRFEEIGNLEIGMAV